MVYSNTLLGGGKSSAKLLFGKDLGRIFLRGANEKTFEEFKNKDKELKGYQKGYTDKR